MPTAQVDVAGRRIVLIQIPARMHDRALKHNVTREIASREIPAEAGLPFFNPSWKYLSSYWKVRIRYGYTHGEISCDAQRSRLPPKVPLVAKGASGDVLRALKARTLSFFAICFPSAATTIDRQRITAYRIVRGGLQRVKNPRRILQVVGRTRRARCRSLRRSENGRHPQGLVSVRATPSLKSRTAGKGADSVRSQHSNGTIAARETVPFSDSSRAVVFRKS
jgi:hypothetical protein